MSENKIMLPLLVIAEKHKLSLEEVLAILISRNLIYASVENVTLISSLISMDFEITDLPIQEMYLQIILGKGTWTGSKIEIRSFNAKSKCYDTTNAKFSKPISISIKDLFVYESELTALEAEQPYLFPVRIDEEPIQTDKVKNTEQIDQTLTQDAVSATSIALQSSPSELKPSLPAIKKRVSTEGQENGQVKDTCRDNPEAVAYVEARQKQGAKPEEIATELQKAGGGVGVIGCLLDPTKPNVKSAREHGKYLLKKAK